MQSNDVKFIDVTPMWEQSLPSLVMLLSHGNEEGRELAYTELRRMAKLADKHMAFLQMEVQ